MTFTPTVIRPPISAILLSMKTALMANGVVNSLEQISVVAKQRKPDHSYTQKDIIIVVGDSLFADDIGGGRWSGKKERTIEVWGRLGSAVDRAYTDEQWIIAQDAFEDKIIDCFNDLPLFDGDANALTTECLHIKQIRRPVKTDDDVWGDSCVYFDVEYQPNIRPDFNGLAG